MSEKDTFRTPPTHRKIGERNLFMKNEVQTGRLPCPAYPDVRDVSVTDGFFAPFVEKIRDQTIPDVLQKFENDGVIENYERVAAHLTGGHGGAPWHHGLICEVITGVSDLLAVRYDAELDRRLDAIIDAFRRAIDADPEGWLHPYDTLVCPDRRFGLNGGSARLQHETYDMGCLVEAGVHHYRSTKKTSLLSVAVRNANYFTDHIGDAPKWNVGCEHSIAEMALLSLEELFDGDAELARAVGAKRGEYRRLAMFFIDHKGDNETRHQFPKYLQEYAQDHRPAREQTEAVGHAVRATLFYTGMAEAAIAVGDAGLSRAVRAIWRDLTETKLHINGCCGTVPHDEKFGQQYELPNNAYLETCAGVGLLFFASSMFRLTRDGSVWETAESTITNLLPAAVSGDGVHYTYQNPLESRGDFERWSWHGCPCCPPMLIKAVGVLPSYLWAAEGEHLWMNLYIDADTGIDGACLSLTSSASGKRLTVSTERARVLHLRIPGWAKRFLVARNGEAVSFTEELHYAVIPIPAGETVLDLSYETPAVKIIAHPLVRSDAERVAVKCGPVLYCREGEAESWEAFDRELSVDPPVKNRDGTVTVRSADGAEIRLIEYRNWNNHGKMFMNVWFRQEGYRADPRDTEGWDGILYRELSWL